MDDLEIRLKSLSVRAPSQGLRERIFGRQPKRSRLRSCIGWRISLPWAAVLMAAMGLAGFSAARFGGRAPAPVTARQTPAVVVQIVEAPPGRQVFDFTATTQADLSGGLNLGAESRNGV